MHETARPQLRFAEGAARDKPSNPRASCMRPLSEPITVLVTARGAAHDGPAAPITVS